MSSFRASAPPWLEQKSSYWMNAAYSKQLAVFWKCYSAVCQILNASIWQLTEAVLIQSPHRRRWKRNNTGKNKDFLLCFCFCFIFLNKWFYLSQFQNQDRAEKRPDGFFNFFFVIDMAMCTLCAFNKRICSHRVAGVAVAPCALRHPIYPSFRTSKTQDWQLHQRKI